MTLFASGILCPVLSHAQGAQPTQVPAEPRFNVERYELRHQANIT